MLNNFQKDYSCEHKVVKIGDEYKVFDPCNDPMWRDISPEAMRALQEQGASFEDLTDR